MPKGIKGFQKGHPTFISEGTYKKIGEATSKRQKGRKISPKAGFQKGHTLQLGEKHWSWKGDKAGKTALHDWVKHRLGIPSLCEHCKTTTAKKFEWANKSHEYKRELSDWIRLCTQCHRKYDNHAQKMWETRKKKLVLKLSDEH